MDRNALWLAVIAVTTTFGLVACGCLLPKEQPCIGEGDCADDDAADDDASDDDASDDDASDDDTGDDDTGDDDTGDDDTGDDDTGDDDTGPTDDTIYDIQLGLISQGTQVQVEHVVVTSPVSTDARGFFAQEPGIPADAAYSGIWVYTHDQGLADSMASVLDVGMTVDIHGVYQEYNELSEIVFDSQTDITPSGTFQLNPAVVDSCDVGTGGSLQEAYEGVLVRVSNVVVTDSNPDDPDEFGEFEVDECLRVDDLFIHAGPAEETLYQALIGVMNYNFYNAKLEPRTAADMLED